MNILRFLTIVSIVASGSAWADDKAIPTYATTGQIKAMAPCTATFAKRLDEYSASFTTADGKTLILGDIRGEQWVWHFVGALREGQTCRLPDAFLGYLEAPHFSREKDISAMAPCTAKLVLRSPCSGTFFTADVRWFSVGDPGSEAEVAHFLWTLKEGKLYEFPAAYLAYKRAPRYVSVQEITAMPPCTATLAAVFSDFCYFTTADGQGFIIGSPDEDSPREVRHFLAALEEEKTYRLPAAFLGREKAAKP